MSEASPIEGYEAGALEHTAAARPKLIRSLQFDYEEFPWAGRDTSGLRPYGKNLIIGVDACPEQTGGGVYLTDQQRELMDAASVTGVVAAAGPEAFRLFDDGTPWQGDKPAVGERVYFEKFAGVLARGADGRVYRILDYRALAAGYTETIEPI